MLPWQLNLPKTRWKPSWLIASSDYMLFSLWSSHLSSCALGLPMSQLLLTTCCLHYGPLTSLHMHFCWAVMKDRCICCTQHLSMNSPITVQELVLFFLTFWEICGNKIRVISVTFFCHLNQVIKDTVSSWDILYLFHEHLFLASWQSLRISVTEI